MLPENWDKMTADEKMDARFQRWMSTDDKEFATEEAAATYRRRAQRFYDIIQLKQPDRVPVTLTSGGVVAEYAGVSHGDLFYDYDKAVKAVIKFHEDFDLDYQSASNFMPGPVYERLDYQLYRWPGHGGHSKDVPFQCLEDEYMMADEYDALIADPEGFLMHRYTPRIMKSLGGLQFLMSFLGTTELPLIPFMLAPATAPPAVAALEAYAEAAQETAKWLGAMGQIAAKTQVEMGLPGTMGGFSKAPFDFIGDTMRGTRGVMLDMYRQPDKLLAACERLVPLAIDMAVSNANGGGNPLILLPLHKGADGFMSNDDFARFYWPTLKETMLGIIEEGVVPWLFVEGGYNQRLDLIAEDPLPAGKSVWMFDQTDMAAAKEKIGGWACIGGNVPASLYKAGSPQQMKDYVKELVDIAAPGGGFFLAPGAVVDDATTENLHAYLAAGKEFGVYN